MNDNDAEVSFDLFSFFVFFLCVLFYFVFVLFNGFFLHFVLFCF